MFPPNLQRGVLTALLMSLVGMTSSASEPFFPIGLFEAGVFPANMRASRTNCPGSDSVYADPRWSQLDDAGGWRVLGDTLSYSRTGFNVVQSYFHLGEDGNWPIEEVLDYVAAARDRGFKVMVTLPAARSRYIGDSLQVILPYRRNYFQREPADFGPARNLMMSILADTSISNHVYGWYMVDEPMNVLRPANCVSATGDSVIEGFHLAAVAPEKLRAAYDTLRTIDDSRPFIITLPDYSPASGAQGSGSDLFNLEFCMRPTEDFWRWDGSACGTATAEFPDPCHPGADSLTLSQNYSNCADVIQNDTYLGPAQLLLKGRPVALASWRTQLHQLDEIQVEDAAEIVLSCDLECTTSVECPTLADPECVRFSLADLRFMAFSSIIHGASGVWFWSYSKTFDNCDQDECRRHGAASEYFLQTVAPLSRELESLTDVFLASRVGTHRWGVREGATPAVYRPDGSLETRIHTVVFEQEDRVVLISANLDSETVAVRYQLNEGEPGSASNLMTSVLISHRRLWADADSVITIRDGAMSDVIEPFGVRVYEFRPGAVIGGLSDFLEIESALQTASWGDTILVNPLPEGLVYQGSLTVPGGVLLLGIPGASRPILDANGSESAITCSSLDGLEAAIENFELRGLMNAGISLDSTANGSLRVENCVIEIDSNAASGATGINGTAAAFSGRQLTVRSTRIESSKTSGSPVGIRWTNTSQSDSVDVVIEDCTIVQNPPLESGVGLVLGSAAGHHLMAGNTISGFGAGISVTLGNYQTWYNATGLLERNVLVGNDVGVSLTGNVTSRQNLAWNLTEDYLPASSGDSSLVVDPRLCDSTFSLNATSPCLPANNPWNVWVGSRRNVTCASGILGTDYSTRPLSLDQVAIPSGLLNLTSDLKIASGRSLSLSGVIAVLADSTDEANLGLDTDANEIVVEGSLTVSGSTELPVVLRSGVSNPAAGSWGGFYVKNGADLRLTDVDLRHGTYGVLAVGLADTVSLVDTSIDSCQQMLVSVNNACLPTPCPTTNVSITGGEFRMRTATHGIHLLKPESVVIDGASIIGTSSGFYGIFADTAGTSTQALIKNCVVEDLSAGTGIYINADSPSLKSNRVVDCKWGIQLRGSGTPAISRVSTSGPGTQLIRCTTGLYVQSTSASVDSVSVKPGGVSGATGVQNSGNSGGAYTKLHVVGGTVGFNATSTANPAPTLRNSRILDFTVNGTKHNGTGGLDLGTSSSEGLNRIESSSASGKWVSVKTCPSGGATLPARSNYWGGTPDPADFSSCVDYADWLSTDPTQPSAVQLSVEAVPPRPFQATPNPFTGGVRLGFSVERPGPIQVRIFDVAGRLVRSVVDSDLDAGAYERDWDGRDDEGWPTPAGIYFARLIEPGRVRAIKLVRLP